MTPRLTPERVRELLDDTARACGDADCRMHPCVACGAAIVARGVLRAAAPDLAADVLALHDALATERERAEVAAQSCFVRWLRAHDEATTAWEAAVELLESAAPMVMLTERTAPPVDTTATAQSFTLTIGGKLVRMDAEHVDRVLEGRRESFWSTRVHTKAAGLRTYDHHHSGNSCMEAVGWTLHVLAGEGMTPTAMAWGLDAALAGCP